MTFVFQGGKEPADPLSSMMQLAHPSVISQAFTASSRKGNSQGKKCAGTTVTARRYGFLIGKQADSEWLHVVPWGLKKLLLYIQDRYDDPHIYITESGVDVPRESKLPLEKALRDDFRTNYFQVSSQSQLHFHLEWSCYLHLSVARRLVSLHRKLHATVHKQAVNAHLPQLANLMWCPICRDIWGKLWKPQKNTMSSSRGTLHGPSSTITNGEKFRCLPLGSAILQEDWCMNMQVICPEKVACSIDNTKKWGSGCCNVWHKCSHNSGHLWNLQNKKRIW